MDRFEQGKLLTVINIRFVHLIEGKCINGEFGRILPGPPEQLSRWARFFLENNKSTNKKVSPKIKQK